MAWTLPRCSLACCAALDWLRTRSTSTQTTSGPVSRQPDRGRASMRARPDRKRERWRMDFFLEGLGLVARLQEQAEDHGQVGADEDVDGCHARVLHGTSGADWYGQGRPPGRCGDRPWQNTAAATLDGRRAGLMVRTRNGSCRTHRGRWCSGRPAGCS